MRTLCALAAIFMTACGGRGDSSAALLKIDFAPSGAITLDGKESSIDALERRLNALKSGGGMALVHRDRFRGGETPQALRAAQLIASGGIPAVYWARYASLTGIPLGWLDAGHVIVEEAGHFVVVDVATGAGTPFFPEVETRDAGPVSRRVCNSLGFLSVDEYDSRDRSESLQTIDWRFGAPTVKKLPLPERDVSAYCEPDSPRRWGDRVEVAGQSYVLSSKPKGSDLMTARDGFLAAYVRPGASNSIVLMHAATAQTAVTLTSPRNEFQFPGELASVYDPAARQYFFYRHPGELEKRDWPVSGWWYDPATQAVSRRVELPAGPWVAAARGGLSCGNCGCGCFMGFKLISSRRRLFIAWIAQPKALPLEAQGIYMLDGAGATWIKIAEQGPGDETVSVSLDFGLQAKSTPVMSLDGCRLARWTPQGLELMELCGSN